jgi:hypothetical protein
MSKRTIFASACSIKFAIRVNVQATVPKGAVWEITEKLETSSILIQVLLKESYMQVEEGC